VTNIDKHSPPLLPKLENGGGENFKKLIKRRWKGKREGKGEKKKWVR